MNRIASTLAGVSLAVLFFVASAHAQSERMTANIPFDFTFGAVSLPAGQYQFSRTGAGGNIVVARNADGHTWFALATAPIEESGLPAKSQLKFAVEDGRDVLVQIWNDQAAVGTELPYMHNSVELAAVDANLMDRR